MIVDIIGWSPEMEIGHQKVDQQHKKLFEIAAMLSGDADQLRVMRVLASLSEYVQVHFREEESLLEEIGYPKLAEHKAIHDAFRARLAKLYTNAGGMALDRITDEVRLMVNDWLVNHILVTDREYVKYLRSDLSLPDSVG